MAFDYDGNAELIDKEGNVIEAVIANLDGSAASWGGHVQATLFAGPEWTDITRIRLENGTEAEITIEEDAAWTLENMQAVDDGSLRTGTVVGIGPPPF